MTRQTPGRKAKPSTATRKAERPPGKDKAEAAAKPTAAGPTAAALAAAEHPDAKLLATCTRFHWHQAGLERWNNTSDFTWEQGDAINEQWWTALKAIVNMPVRTLDGLKAKALVLEKATFGVEASFETNDELAVAFARDVMAFAAEAGGASLS